MSACRAATTELLIS